MFFEISVWYTTILWYTAILLFLGFKTYRYLYVGPAACNGRSHTRSRTIGEISLLQKNYAATGARSA